MLNRIVIITPAIPRKGLHTESFKHLYNSLNGYKEKNIEIIHIINIDSPEKILKLGYNLEETIDNFNKIIPEDVKKIYLHGYKPCFSEAYVRIWIEAEKYMNDKSVLLFFEDDWNIIKDFNYIKILFSIKENNLNNNFLLTSHHYINNAPHIISYELYKLYVKFLKSHNFTSMDPDYIRGNFYKYGLKKYKVSCNLIRLLFKQEDLDNLNKYYYKTFKRIKIKEITQFKILNFNTNYYDALLEKNKLKYISNYKNESIESNLELNIYTPVINISYDIGRKWRDNINLNKWEKDDKNSKTY